MCASHTLPDMRCPPGITCDGRLSHIIPKSNFVKRVRLGETQPPRWDMAFPVLKLSMRVKPEKPRLS
jgi:hypothetical protein